MKSVLVTGGAGYIGSHACKALASAGYVPVTYDNLCRGNAWAVRWGPLEEGDILDEGRLAAVMTEYGVEGVMHFASFAYVGESNEQPLLYYNNNVGGMISLARAMQQTGVRKIVFSSSCTIFGDQNATSIDEGLPLNPISPYGMSKVTCERIIEDMVKAEGISAAVLRYFNAAGADPDLDVGEAHDPEPHLIPRILEAAINGTVVEIYGDDYPTPDGSCVRDYVHVSDLATVHVTALESFRDTPEFSPYNLGTGIGHSVKEVIAGDG